MFKNFDKVFKFTFKNQVSPKSYKTLTTVVAIILFALPVIILALMASSKKNNGELLPSGIKKMYVVNEAKADADFNALNTLNVAGYTDIQYVPAASVSEALISAGKESTSAVWELKKEGNETSSTVIIPKGSSLTKKEVGNFSSFIKKNQSVIAVIANGVSFEALASISVPVSGDIYTADGFSKGISLSEDQEAVEEQITSSVRPIFNLFLVLATIMIVYFIVIFYGNSIMQNIVLEKSSKLMDTMLISVKPAAMIAGKMLGVLCAALIQFFLWIIALVGGFVSAIAIADKINPNANIAFITYVKNFDTMGIFTPVSVTIGILVLLFGILLYSAISAICGSISSSREEAAANQGLFTVILLISFYIVLFGGLKENAATWMYIFPTTSAMLLPAGVCAGSVSLVTAIIGLAVMVVSTVVLIILAGKFYVMMSLYKGNKVSLTKAFKMLSSKQ